MKIAVVVPTLNALPVWEDCINALSATSINADDVYIYDSGSVDGTVTQAKNAGFNVRVVAQGTFDHGGTRQKAVDELVEYEFVVFLTQDAILSHPDALQSILQPFEDVQVAAVCGRQLPRKGSGHIEAHARLYNYPAKSSLNDLDDRAVKGLKSAFMSNSFAAYRIPLLSEVGGFPDSVIFGEDMFVAAKMLLAGYKVAYEADASVYHSHGYSLWQEMKRYFDMGVFHANEAWIRQELGGAEGEGVKFVVSELRYVSKHEYWRVPEVLVRTVLRYSGFRLGLIEKKLPFWLKRELAMNKRYFKR